MTDTTITRLRRGEIMRSMMIGNIPHPKIVEAVGAIGGVDCIWFDQEHSTVSDAQLEVLLIACRAAGIDAFTRVPPTDYVTLMRPLEAGCSGLMVAQIRTVQEVQQVARWCKFPPQGERGFFGSKADAHYATLGFTDHVEKANRDTWLAIQIETAESVEVVDEIAAQDGVDVLFVGPADLSLALGVPGEVLHPKCVDALERVSAAAKKANKPWGIVCHSMEHAAKCRELGCQLFSIYNDIGLVHYGLAAVNQTFADLH